MRLLACADLHIGAGASHRVDHLADTARTLEQIVDAAVEHNCQAVLVAGDCFHRPKPTPPELHLFARFAQRLAEAGILTIAAHGNAGHDQVSGDESTALELFATPRMRVSRRPESIDIGGNVEICTLPSVPPARLRALLADRGELDATSETMAALLVDVAAELRANVPDRCKAVLLGHWAVSGASLPTGLPSDSLHEPVLDLQVLIDQEWDAVILGHLHRFQVLSDDPLVAYVGSPMVMDFSEGSYDHGVMVIDLEGIAA